MLRVFPLIALTGCAGADVAPALCAASVAIVLAIVLHWRLA